MRYVNLLGLGLGLVLLVLLTGCGTGGYVPAKGVIKWEDGTPIQGADIRFVPKDKEKPEAIAFSDAQGKFSLNTGPKEGAMRGDYTVVVTKFATGVDTEKLANPGDPTAQDPIKAMQGMMKKGKGGPVKNQIPADYGDAAKSPLQVKIDGAKEDIDLTIKKS